MVDTDNDVSDDRSFYGLALTVPFGLAATKDKAKSASHRFRVSSGTNRRTPKRIEIEALDSENTLLRQNLNIESSMNAIADRLMAHQLERIDIGLRGEQLVVAFENNTYNVNELDALGIALGIIAYEAKGSFSEIVLILKNQNLAVIQLSFRQTDYKLFLEGEIDWPSMQITLVDNSVLEPVTWYKKKAYRYTWRPRISFSPHVINTLASEPGVWDHSTGLRAALSLSLWRGGLIHASHLDVLEESSDFQKGGPFFAAGDPSGFKDISFQQAFRPHAQLLSVFDMGRYRYHFRGGQNKSYWSTKNGRHQLESRIGKYAVNKHSTDYSKEIYLATYRYYWPHHDIKFEATKGKFWNQDRGWRFDVKFRFGDVTWALMLKSTDVDIVGLHFEIPLTRRRDFNHRWLQVKGAERWRYGVQTQIRNDANYINSGSGDLSQADKEIEVSYFNGDRLNPDYINSNLLRLRDAYQRYVSDGL